MALFRFALIALIAFCSLVAAGCHSAQTTAKDHDANSAGRHAAAQAGQTAQAPAPGGEGGASSQIDPDVLAMQGGMEFSNNCARCHNPGGRAPDLFAKSLWGWKIRFMVRHGPDGMPAFSTAQLSDAKLDAIVAYLQQAEADKSAAPMK